MMIVCKSILAQLAINGIKHHLPSISNARLSSTVHILNDQYEKHCFNGLDQSRQLHSTTRNFQWGQKSAQDETNPDLNDPAMEGITTKDLQIVSSGFRSNSNKNSEAFLEVIDDFKKHGNEKRRQGQVEFVYAALKYMKEYGVNKDIKAYKALLEVFPKDLMKPTSVFQMLSPHCPKQQFCCVKLLDEMEYNYLMPDKEMQTIVIDRFSKYSIVWRKLARMAYWGSKFKVITLND